MEKDFDIFISYSHKDLNKVKEIKAIIEQSTVARCWMDLKGGIKSGDPKFIKTITDAINNSVVFLFMRSANSQISEYATLELSYAKKETNSHVVIVNIDDSEWINEFRFLYRYTDKIDWANQDQREKLMSDIQSWIEKRNEIKSKAEEEARSIVEAKIQKLEKDRDDLLEELANKRDMTNKFKIVLENTQMHLADEREKLIKAEEKIQDLNEMINSLHQELKKKKGELNNVYLAAEEKDRYVEKLVAKLNEEENLRSKEEKRRKELQDECDNLRLKLGDITDKINKLYQEITEKALQRRSDY